LKKKNKKKNLKFFGENKKKKKKKKKKHNLHIKSSKHILEVKLHSVNYLKSLLQEDDKKSTYKSYWT